MFGRRLGSLLVLFISISIISTASATLITQGTTEIIGNKPGLPNTGSFKVEIDYAVYNGTSDTDPLGKTTDEAQITFRLTSVDGGDGELPDVNFGRFTVFAPDVWSTTQFYTGSAVLDSNSDRRGPRKTNLHAATPPNIQNLAEFIFDSGLAGIPRFAPGEVSKLLVLRTSMANLPATILLEIDNTNASGGLDGDVYIDIPEPFSLAIFGGALLFSLRRFRKR